MSVPAWRRPLLRGHQAEAVETLRAIIDAYGGAIHADAIGSGKSYVALDLAARVSDRGERVTIVVPASLLDQWKRLSEEFEIAARLLSHDVLRTRPIVPAEWTDGLVIVDEAHRFRNPRTARYDALARLVASTPVLLVTATPFWNRIDDLAALVRLFAADDRFAGSGVASIERAFATGDAVAVATVVRAVSLWRSRAELKLELFVPSTERITVPFAMPAIVEQFEHELSALRFPAAPPIARALCRDFLRRQFASGIAAVRASLQKQRRYYLHAASEPGQMLSPRAFFRLHGTDDVRPMQSVMFPELWSGDRISVSHAELEEELEHLSRMLRLLQQPAGEPKLDALASVLRFEPAPVLLFTHSVETAIDLGRAFGGTSRWGVLTSRMTSSRGRRCEPWIVTDAFRRGGVDLLIATDLASEGLNLQSARTVVHYDLPWNEVKSAQRTGRTVRLGSNLREVRVVVFVAEDERYSRQVPLIEAKARQERSLIRAIAALPPSGDRAAMWRPPLLARSSGQSELYERLSRRELLDLELRWLLTLRYSTGIERMLQEIAREYLDDGRIKALREWLGRASAWRHLGGTTPESSSPDGSETT